MTRLQEVTTRMVRGGDSTSPLQEILDAAIGITSADMGNIQLLDSKLGRLRIAASCGFERPFLDYFDSVHEGQASCGTAMARQERVIVEDVTFSPIFVGTPALDVLLAAGVRAVQSSPLVGRSGRLVGMLSTHYRAPGRPTDRDLRILDLLARQAADWTERLQAEQALRDSEERFRRYFELGLIGMAITSPGKECLEVNDRMCEILGYQRAELLRMTWAEMTHPDDLAADLALFDQVIAGEIDGYTLEKRWIRKDGAVIDSAISLSCVRLPDRSVDCFVALVEDVTERKRNLEALRQSEERYRLLLSQVRDYAIFSTDEDGVISSWNAGCESLFGYGQREFVGLEMAELFTPEDRAQDVPAMQLRQAVETGTVRNDRWMIAKGGRRLYAMGAMNGLRDSAGGLIGFTTVMRDMTQMKLSQDELAHRGERLARLVILRTGELEKTTERLRAAERMASLGTLAAGLGHDMGNLLLPLDVRLQLLLQAGLPGELHEHVLGIQTCAHHLQRMATGLRLLAVDPAASRARQVTELGTWWIDVEVMLRSVLPRDVRLECHLPPEDCWVAMERVALTQAVFNLVQNSADALKARGAGTVVVAAEDAADTGHVVLRVTDNGEGMPEEVVQRCMEPYFSTKPRGTSTGMGLAFVYGQIAEVGGRVEVESVASQGTTFSLHLPRAVSQEHRSRR
jgi:PAS domain S-box-containing protein